MKNEEIKRESFKEETLNIDKEINISHTLKLFDLLNSSQSDHLTIKMNDITKGSFTNALEFGNILHSSDRKIIIMCSGIINLTGIIPLLANHDNDKIVFRNAKFFIDIVNYKENYVEPEYLDIFDEIIKDLLDRNTLLSYPEIIFLNHFKKVYSAEEFIELGIIEDIYSMFTDNKSDSDIVRRIIQRKEIFERRNQRDKMKCEGQFSLISFSKN